MSNSYWRKLERAEHHLESLKDFLKDYNSRNLNILRQEYNEISNVSCFVAHICDDPKDSLALLIGDIIHNARASLDHLSCQLLIDDGFVPSKQTYYPFVEKTSNLNKRLKETMLSNISIEKQSYFNSNPPSKEANQSLYALHILDIKDKHKSITPVASYVHIQHLIFVPRLNLPGCGCCRMPLRHGNVFFGRIPGMLSSSDFSCESFPVFTITDDDLGFIWSDIHPEVEDNIVTQLEAILSEVKTILSHFYPS